MDLSDLTDGQRREILREVKEYTQKPRLEQDEFTVRQYAESFDPPLNMRTARDRLVRMMDDGRLEGRKVLHGGYDCWAFRLVEGAADPRDDV